MWPMPGAMIHAYPVLGALEYWTDDVLPGNNGDFFLWVEVREDQTAPAAFLPFGVWGAGRKAAAMPLLSA